MRYAILSDVHGNLEALQAVLADTRNRDVDQIIFLGDAVGYGASPSECLKLLQREVPILLAGNHDHAAAGLTPVDRFNPIARISLEWTRKRLSERDTDLLAELPLCHVEGELYFVHASPERPADWKYVRTMDDIQAALEAIPHRFCFVGHTHIAMAASQDVEGWLDPIHHRSVRFEEEKRYFFNVGSVGQPRDGNERACYLIFDGEAKTATFRRVSYDLERSQEKILENNLPSYLAERLVEAK